MKYVFISNIISLLFPLLSTPLVAKIVGSNGFVYLSYAALTQYVVSSLADGGLNSSAVSRWGRRARYGAARSLSIDRIRWLQLVASILILALATSAVALVSIEVVGFVFIGGLAGVLSTLTSSWVVIFLSLGREYAVGGVASKLISLGLLSACIAIDIVAPGLIAVIWLLLPAAVQLLFLLTSKRFRTGIFPREKWRGGVRFGRLLLGGVGYRLTVIAYATPPTVLLGAIFPKSDVGVLLLLDRFRVISQTFLVANWGVVGKIRARSKRLASALVYGYVALFAICFPAIAVYLPGAIFGQGAPSLDSDIVMLYSCIGVAAIVSGYLINVIAAERGRITSVYKGLYSVAAASALIYILSAHFASRPVAIVSAVLVVELLVLFVAAAVARR